jgi:hypothetical protein
MSHYAITKWVSPSTLVLLGICALILLLQYFSQIRQTLLWLAGSIWEMVCRAYYSLYEICRCRRRKPVDLIKKARENWLRAARNKKEFLRRPEVSMDHPAYASYVQEELAELTHYIALKGKSTREEKIHLRMLRDMVQKRSGY